VGAKTTINFPPSARQLRPQFTGSYAQDPDATVTKAYLFCVSSL